MLWKMILVVRIYALLKPTVTIVFSPLFSGDEEEELAHINL